VRANAQGGNVEQWYKSDNPALMRRQISVGCTMKPFLSIGVLGMGLSSFQLAAHPLDNWHLRYSGPGGSASYHAITYGDGLFVVGGSAGAIVTSPDAQNWFPQASGTTGTLLVTAHGGHTFVMVGLGGLILSSPHGTNWTQRTSGTTADLRSVVFGGGLFLAVGGNVLLTSPDGENWAAQNVGGSFTGSSAVYGNGLFLLPGPSGTNFLSSNGTNWFSRASGTGSSLYTAGFGNGMFMEIDINQRVLTSTDGSNWTARSTVTLLRPSQIAYGSGCFVICGGGSTQYTEDAMTWITPASGYLSVGNSAVFAQSTFVIVGGGTKVLQSDPVLMLEMPFAGTLLIDGRTGQPCWVEATDQLGSAPAWIPLTNFALPYTPYLWTDTTSSNSPQRFYRAALGP
jgi:hypothetical protein